MGATLSLPPDDERVIRFASGVARAGFTVAYNLVVFDRTLSVHARLLYLQLSHYAWLCEHAKRDSPEQAEIAANLGIKERGMRPYVGELEERGLLQVRRRGRGMTNLYTILEPVDNNQDRQNTAGLDRQNTAAETGKKLPVHREKREDVKTASSNELARAVWTPIYDALVRECYPAGATLTRREQQQVVTAAKNIASGNGTAELVPAVKRAYLGHTSYGKCALTAMALSSRWSELAPVAALAACPLCGIKGGRHAADCEAIAA